MPPAPRIPKGERVSAVDRVVDQIRTMIATESLAVGDSLPTERELVQRFGTSRNTVREALRVVKAYGVIDVQTKTGAVISDRGHEAIRELFAFQLQLSPASFRDVQGFRRLVEVGLCDQLLENASPQDFDHLEATSRRIVSATSSEEAGRRDFEFHLQMIELSHNRTLIETYKLLRPVISHVMTIGKMSQPLLEDTDKAHRNIINMLRTQDRLGYAYHMVRHLDFGLRFFEQQANNAAEAKG